MQRNFPDKWESGNSITLSNFHILAISATQICLFLATFKVWLFPDEFLDCLLSSVQLGD